MEIASAISIAVPVAAAPKTAQLPMAVAKENAGRTMEQRARTNESQHGREPRKTKNQQKKQSVPYHSEIGALIMGYINTTFLGKEYSIPQDVLIYIDLLDFTDSVQKQLASTFVRKLRNEIAKDNIGLLGDEDLAAEIEQQVGKFIAKLCDNGIFTRTISDYLKNNKGYQLYTQVNKAALEKMKSLLIQEMDAWQAGYEDAINKAESHVTGMGFSIWSSSFVNHAIYAAMEASTLNKQSREAESQYQRDMKDLSSRLDSKYGGEKSNYINNTYIPNMEAALTVFAYELLDKYVADLIANGKFDGKTLDYVRPQKILCNRQRMTV